MADRIGLLCNASRGTPRRPSYGLGYVELRCQLPLGHPEKEHQGMFRGLVETWPVTQLSKPIPLPTPDFSWLAPWPGDFRDEVTYPIGGATGVHVTCGGDVGHHIVSERCAALFCKSCGLRVVLPRGLKTWAELRAWAEMVNALVSE